jgi:prepilin-type N-terminal cleavage/methylation domain-containing protein
MKFCGKAVIMKRRLISNKEGFTLLEVMVSMLIMSFSLLLLLQMAMVALDGNTWASGTTSCTQLMQEKLEEIRSLPNPQSGQDTVGTITRNWTVNKVSSHLRQVDITAVWMTPDNRSHSNTINTFIKTDSL